MGCAARQAAALDARLQEIALLCLTNDPRWARATTALAEDLVKNEEVAEMLATVCTYITNLALYNYGHNEAVERFSEDLKQLRTIARKVVYP